MGTAWYKCADWVCPISIREVMRGNNREKRRLMREIRVTEFESNHTEQRIADHLKSHPAMAKVEAQTRKTQEGQLIQLTKNHHTLENMNSHLQMVSTADHIHKAVATNNDYLERFHGMHSPEDVQKELVELGSHAENTHLLVSSSDGAFQQLQDVGPQGEEDADAIVKRISDASGIEIVETKKKTPLRSKPIPSRKDLTPKPTPDEEDLMRRFDLLMAPKQEEQVAPSRGD